jgi:predicted P-loop ATPase
VESFQHVTFKAEGPRHPRLMLVILGTQEAEIRRIKSQSQPRQIVHETLSQNDQSQKRTGVVAQGVGPEFKPQYHKKRQWGGKGSISNMASFCSH